VLLLVHPTRLTRRTQDFFLEARHARPKPIPLHNISHSRHASTRLESPSTRDAGAPPGTGSFFIVEQVSQSEGHLAPEWNISTDEACM